MDPIASAKEYRARAARLNALYRRGAIHAKVPEGLLESTAPLDDLAARHLPASGAALTAASKSLFYSLPVAFDPAQSVGPYLATVDRDERGEPFRFLDMGSLIATNAFGENEPAVIDAVLENLPFVVSRYAHSEYQTTLSLRLKASLDRLAPRGAPRHFVVNTGAESVENAIKAVLLHRVKTAEVKEGGFIISFEGAFHGRTLGALAVTHRKKARLGFPTFDWPHVSFPAEEPSAPKDTARREERSLKQIWDLLVSGRLPHAEKSKDAFRREMAAIDEFLASSEAGLAAFVQSQRTQLTEDVRRRSRQVAAVLLEPIQGEGGVRMTTPRFMRRLRMFTLIYDVPLIYDEVQTGWGTTGHLWAHEMFDLPAPPDVVTWAKKAQNGVLFVSEELATFFQEEKKFNTTWEGDSTGMVRLMAVLDRLDLEQVRRTGSAARDGLCALAREFPGFLKSVRGAGVMLAFDVVRADWRNVLRDRAFRLGLILLPAGERSLRFYPRHDTEPYAIEEAIGLLRRAVTDIVGGLVPPHISPGPEVRAGTLDCPLEAIEVVELSAAGFEAVRDEILAVEIERYGAMSQYPPDVLQAGGRPLLQYPAEALEATMAAPHAVGAALRDRISGRIIAYALGSALENHDEEGVGADPHNGENNTFYLQALAVSSSIRNQTEVENHLLDLLRERVLAAGYEFLSTLIEARIHETGPEWLRRAQVLQSIDNYLCSGLRFAYLQGRVVREPSAVMKADGD